MQALFWYRGPPGYYAGYTRQEALQQVASLEQFISQCEAVLGQDGGGVAAGTRSWPQLRPASSSGGAAGGWGVGVCRGLQGHHYWQLMHHASMP